MKKKPLAYLASGDKKFPLTDIFIDVSVPFIATRLGIDDNVPFFGVEDGLEARL